MELILQEICYCQLTCSSRKLLTVNLILSAIEMHSWAKFDLRSVYALSVIHFYITGLQCPKKCLLIFESSKNESLCRSYPSSINILSLNKCFLYKLRKFEKDFKFFKYTDLKRIMTSVSIFLR